MGVHAGGRLVQQQQFGIRRQCPDNLQPALCAVGQTAGLLIRQILHSEDIQELHRPFVLVFFLFPVPRKTQNSRKHIVPDLVVKADPHVFFHRHFIKEADVLEGAGNAEPGGLNNAHTVQVLAVHQHRSGSGFVYFGQQVKHGCLAHAVGADQAGDLGFHDGQIEIVHSLQAAELNPEMTGFQNRNLIHIPFRNDGMRGHRHHFCVAAVLFDVRHYASPPETEFFFPRKSPLTGATARPKTERISGLFVKIITRISTTA